MTTRLCRDDSATGTAEVAIVIALVSLIPLASWQLFGVGVGEDVSASAGSLVDRAAG